METGPGLVIGQVYAGGGEPGSSYNADYVELFNRGAAPVSLSGYRLQFASAYGTDTFPSSVVLSGALAPGQAYLVQLRSTSGGRALPTPDRSDVTVALQPDGGKVVLVQGNGLACNGGTVPCSDDPSPREPATSASRMKPGRIRVDGHGPKVLVTALTTNRPDPDGCPWTGPLAGKTRARPRLYPACR